MSFKNSDIRASLDAGAYTVILAAILGLGYAIQYFNVKKLSNNLSAILWRSIQHHDKINAKESDNTTESRRRYHRTWWTDEKTFQLERRAIFSKSWLLVTHTSRFQKPGDYRTFEISGFSFIIILGKDKQLRAFHNVCRHRAYAVTKKESGSSIVLGCRYHGWSYDTKGKLIKAPEFENVAGFDKDVNGLWELKLEVRESMVFVNFDARMVSCKLELGTVTQSLKRWRTEKLACLAEWKVDGHFNWKVAIEWRPINGGSISKPAWARVTSMLRTKHEEISISPCGKVIRLETGSVLIVRLLPQSKSRTIIECSLYGMKANGSSAMTAEVEKLQQTTQSEIKDLEAKQRKFLGQGTGVTSDEQDSINELLEAHLDLERKLGAEIHPAARKQNITQEGKDDDDLCKELESSIQTTGLCSANNRGDLDW